MVRLTNLSETKQSSFGRFDHRPPNHCPFLNVAGKLELLLFNPIDKPQTQLNLSGMYSVE
jgi:hypothetical protein